MASFIVPLILISATVLFLVRRCNKKRERDCTKQVEATVVKVVHKTLRHMGVTPGNSSTTYYTIEYSVGNRDYTATLVEMKGKPQVGDTVQVLIDPLLPEHVFAAGMVEKTNRELRRTCLICICIVVFFCLIALGMYITR